MHFLLENHRFAIMVAAQILVLALELRAPAVTLRTGRWRHTARNLMITVPWVATFTSAGVITIWVASRTTDAHWGLLNMVTLPVWAKVVLGILALDFMDYWRHRFSHEYSILWRLHRLHHSDPLMEGSTTLRNHPLAIIPIVAVRSLAIVIFGLTPLTMVIYGIVLLPAQYFHHMNIRLPDAVDKFIGLVVVTPGYHFMHHARQEHYTNSQYGTILMFWDRLFGTLWPAPERAATAQGLDEFSDDASQSLVGMLATPLEENERMFLRLRAPAP